jgi:hypothetical protein
MSKIERKRRMKKGISILLAVIAFSMAANAQNNGYEKSIEIYGGPAMNKTAKYSFGISLVNGYRINPHLYAGLGVGFRYTDAEYMHTYRSYKQFGVLQTETSSSYAGDYLLPVHARAQYNFTTTKVKPMLLCDAGYTFNVGSVEGNAIGFFWEPAFGIDIDLEEHTSLYFQLGICMQNTHYTYYTFSYYDGASSEEIHTKGSTFNIKVGMKF